MGSAKRCVDSNGSNAASEAAANDVEVLMRALASPSISAILACLPLPVSSVRAAKVLPQLTPLESMHETSSASFSSNEATCDVYMARISHEIAENADYGSTVYMRRSRWVHSVRGTLCTHSTPTSHHQSEQQPQATSSAKR